MLGATILSVFSVLGASSGICFARPLANSASLKERDNALLSLHVVEYLRDNMGHLAVELAPGMYYHNASIEAYASAARMLAKLQKRKKKNWGKPASADCPRHVDFGFKRVSCEVTCPTSGSWSDDSTLTDPVSS